MIVRILSTCTSEKAIECPGQLSLQDFQSGINAKEGLPSVAAVDLYQGAQHKRLMQGVQEFRRRRHQVQLGIVSAGYGLVSECSLIQPYEATFLGMSKAEVRAWGWRLGLPTKARSFLGATCDLCLVLLSEAYAQACLLDQPFEVGAPTVFLVSKATSSFLWKAEGSQTVVLTNEEARIFRCGLVGLKGEVASRILLALADDSGALERMIAEPTAFVRGLGGRDATTAVTEARDVGVQDSRVDWVISLGDGWKESPHRASMAYFIPEWDDLVDPDYDFLEDRHSGGSGDWSNEVYAHQMFPSPNYDGILMSRAVVDRTRRKLERIQSVGVHRYLRVPPEFPVMGDCGAFDYIGEEVPPYTTEDVLQYYTELGFDYGVSVDHLIVKATEQQKHFRFELTLENARDFLNEHRKRGLPWVPIGAVQGWSPESYALGARSLVDMGYGYIGLGGLVRNTTDQILDTVRAVRAAIPGCVRIHLFGIARPNAIRRFLAAGVSSIDSASPLRQAWLGAGKNYLSLDGRSYTAIRIPESGKSFRAKRMVTEGRATEEEVRRLEADCLAAVRSYGRGEIGKDETIRAILAYDALVDNERPDSRRMLDELLEDRPWERCPCPICTACGIEVVIFRGNNRNRRRGFHNTFVFYEIFRKAVVGGDLPERWSDRKKGSDLQGTLFDVLEVG